jgi:hypothetical protein
MFSIPPGRFIRLAILCAAFVTVIPGEAPGQVGSTGMSFLKLGTDARSAGLSGSTVAIASGAAASTQNPAGLASAPDSQKTLDLLFTHREWIQDTRIEYLAVRIGLGGTHALGVSLSSLSTSDIEIRERPGPAQGTFTARNASLGVSYGRAFGDVAIGITAKLLYEKILVDDATGFAVDLGGKWSPLPRLVLGAAVQHLGGMSALREDATALPTTLRLGPSYSLRWEEPRLDILLAGDAAYIPEEGEPYASLGGEFTYDGLLAARLGYQFGSAGRGFSAGAGFRYGLFLLDYAYAPIDSDLGNTHTITVGLMF